MKFKKGDNVLAVSKQSDRKIQFKVPSQMCAVLLTRYIALYLGETDTEWLFVKQ